MSDEKSQNTSEFEQFLSILGIEGDPLELIDTALKISDKTARKLPVEKFVLRIYESREDVVLVYDILSHLVTWLLKRSNNDELLKLLCPREFKLVQKFGGAQSADVRQALLVHMKDAQTKRLPQNREIMEPVRLAVGIDERSLRLIVDEEFAKGARADVRKCTAALLALPDEKSPTDLFMKFLIFLSRLPMRTIALHDNEFVKPCGRKFGSPELISFLGRPDRAPKHS
jgi:hypothetical protein